MRYGPILMEILTDFGASDINLLTWFGVEYLVFMSWFENWIQSFHLHSLLPLIPFTSRSQSTLFYLTPATWNRLVNLVELILMLLSLDSILTWIRAAIMINLEKSILFSWWNLDLCWFPKQRCKTIYVD